MLQTALLQAKTPIASLAKQLRIKPHTARRALDSLYSKRVLVGYRPYININALGMSEHLIFLSVSNASQKTRKALLSAFCRHDHVGFVAEMGGDFQYELRFYSRSSDDILNFLDSLAEAFHARIQISSISVIHEEEYSGVKYTSVSGSPTPVLRYGPVSNLVTLDPVDHRILHLVANSSITAEREIARQLGIPASTIGYRIKRLESEGVIVGYYHLCDVKPLGESPLSLLLKSSTMKKSTRSRLIDFCRNHERIAYINILVGPWSARIFARVQHYDQGLEIAHRLLDEFQSDVQSIQVMPQLKFHKCSLFPFGNLKSP